MRDKNSQAFIVTGFSRSGTSVTMSLLRACGVYLGEDKDLREATHRNPRGYFEHTEVLRLNKNLITEAGFTHGRDFLSSTYGGTFKGLSLNPARSYRAKFSRRHTLRDIQKFIAEMNKYEKWGFKTRATTFRIWKKFIPNLKLIITYRSPLANVSSHMISSKEMVSFQRTLRDWIDTNRELLYDISANESLVIQYEDLFSRTDEALNRLINFVGNGKKEDLRSIVEPQLNRAQNPVKDLEGVYPLGDEALAVLRALKHFKEKNI